MLKHLLLLGVVSATLASCNRAPDNPGAVTTPPSQSVEVQSQKSLSALNARRLEILAELRTLSNREAELQALIQQSVPDAIAERQEREQLRISLRELQQQQATLEKELSTNVAAQNRVSAQGNNNALERQQLQGIQTQVATAQAELAALIERRDSLRSLALTEGSSLGEQDVNSSQLTEVNAQITAKISELEQLSNTLNSLANSVSSQGTESGAGASQAELNAQASQLRASIATKQRQITTLQNQIDALLRNTDLFSIEQREELEQERNQLQASLRTEQEQLATIEARLRR